MSFEFLRANAEALLLMLLTSVLGGVATYVRKLLSKETAFSLFGLVCEAVISASAGVTAGLLVIDHASLGMTLAATSVAAHMGTRFFYVVEALLQARLKAAADKS